MRISICVLVWSRLCENSIFYCKYDPELQIPCCSFGIWTNGLAAEIKNYKKGVFSKSPNWSWRTWNGIWILRQGSLPSWYRKSIRLNFKTSFTSNSHTEVFLRLTIEWCSCWDWNKKSGTNSMKAVPGGARNKRVRFAAPSICHRIWWFISYMRILYRCEDYFTGKTMCYQFPRFANPQSEISTSYMATCWHRKEAGPALARQRLFETALHNCRHSTLWTKPIRLESCTDARFIWISVRTGLYDRFDLIFTPIFSSPLAAGWSLLIAQGKGQR